jgi:hypothetical protein
MWSLEATWEALAISCDRRFLITLAVYFCDGVTPRFTRCPALAPLGPLAWELEQCGSIVRLGSFSDPPVRGDAGELCVDLAVVGLASATLFTFRSRCVVGRGPTRRELPWSSPVVFSTLEVRHDGF